MEIKQTKDYSRFEPITGNRNLNLSKVQKIVNDINQGFNMLPYCPIIVSPNKEKLSIVDGQHRFEVSQQTENPVYYVECESLTLKQIAIMNSRGEKWKAIDFLKCYQKLGIDDYKKISYIVNKYHINIFLAVDLLMFNSPKADSTDIFQSGEFKCNYLDET